MIIKREQNENEEQFLWRLGQAKDLGTLELDWTDIADLMNHEFREDETEYRNESAYRKAYQYAKRFYEADVFKKYNDNSYTQELLSAKDEIRKEKQKLFDERKALNRLSRESARAEENLLRLEEQIRENGRTTLPEINLFIDNEFYKSGNDLIISLSDFHLGATFNNSFGCYDSDIAAKRLSRYLMEILEIQRLHKAENAYVVIGGDSISGHIHWTTQLENRENVIEQVQKCAELISAFVYELSKSFAVVHISSVAGNHSRIGHKDLVVRSERLDDLIPWYMKAKLSHLNNVVFLDGDNIDSTIASFTVRQQVYLAVHGDFDSYSEAGVSKLVMMLGVKPHAVFYGHMHHCSYDDIYGVKIIRTGSFCGTGDDYTVSKRISGKPSQMVCVVNADGVKACYPVDLC